MLPLVDDKITKEEARLSEQSKTKLRSISRKAMGLNKAAVNQIVNDKVLKRERKADERDLEVVKRRKGAEDGREEMERVSEKRMVSKMELRSDLGAQSPGQESTQSSQSTGQESTQSSVEVSSHSPLGAQEATRLTAETRASMHVKDSNSIRDESGDDEDHSERLDSPPSTQPKVDSEFMAVKRRDRLQELAQLNPPQSPNDKENAAMWRTLLKKTRNDEKPGKSVGDGSPSTESNIFGVSLSKTSKPGESIAVSNSSESSTESNIFGVSLSKTRKPGESIAVSNSSESSNTSPWPVKLRSVASREDRPFLSPQAQGSSSKPDGVDRGNGRVAINPRDNRHLSPIQGNSDSSDTDEGGSESGEGQHELEEVNKEARPLSPAVAALRQTFTLLPGDTIDLTNLPKELIPLHSKIKIVPITNNNSNRSQVLVMGRELLMIAQRREEEGESDLATVLWYQHYDQIISLNMLANHKDDNGAVGADISTVDGTSYPLYFEHFQLFNFVLQTFYNFKNGVEDESSQGVQEVKVQEKKSPVAPLFNPKELATIKMFRKMLDRGTSEDAVRYKLENDDVTMRVRDAILETADESNEDETQSEIKKITAILCQIPMATEGVVAHPLAGLLEARATLLSVKPGVPNKDEDPSINKVKALFGQKSTMLKENEAAQPDDRDTAKQDISGIPLKDDPEYTKYFKMLKMGLPMGAVKNALHRDGKDPSIMDLDPNKSVKSQLKSEEEEVDRGTPLKDDPEYTKYFKMLKMGLPIDAVKNALQRDDKDPSILDLDPNKSIQSQLKSGEEEVDRGTPLKDDPEYTRYFKMMKMGLPMGAVKNALQKDGKDPSIVDLDPNKSLVFQRKKKSSSSNTKTAKAKLSPKDNFRRTRVHWDTIEEVKDTTLWARVKKDSGMSMKIDESEFNKLFKAERGKTITTTETATKKKKVVQVIDPKRAGNGGIILARAKIAYEEMAAAIDTFDEKPMPVEQIESIQEYIPTKEEREQLRAYMNSVGKDSTELKNALCECEKFMVAMAEVEHCKEKARALLFKFQFQQRITDLRSSVTLVDMACDELKGSEKFRNILGLVLNIGNRLNTAGSSRKKGANAIAIDSLVKLNQAKAVDNKTTVLHFIVRTVLEQNETLATFKEDLPSVLKADRIYWAQIENDLKDVEGEVENLRKMASLTKLDIRKCSLSPGEEALESLSIDKFTLRAINSVSNLQKDIKSTAAKFSALRNDYFGEKDEKAPHELFENICIFTKDFYATKEELSAELAETAKRKKRALDATPLITRRALFNTPTTSDRDWTDVRKSMLQSKQQLKPQEDTDQQTPKPVGISKILDANATPHLAGSSTVSRLIPRNIRSDEREMSSHDALKKALLKHRQPPAAESKMACATPAPHNAVMQEISNRGQTASLNDFFQRSKEAKQDKEVGPPSSTDEESSHFSGVSIISRLIPRNISSAEREMSSHDALKKALLKRRQSPWAESKMACAISPPHNTLMQEISNRGQAPATEAPSDSAIRAPLNDFLLKKEEDDSPYIASTASRSVVRSAGSLEIGIGPDGGDALPKCTPAPSTPPEIIRSDTEEFVTAPSTPATPPEIICSDAAEFINSKKDQEREALMVVRKVELAQELEEEHKRKIEERLLLAFELKNGIEWDDEDEHDDP